MNNILPSSIRMHLKFDLKGSTYKRKVNNKLRQLIWKFKNHVVNNIRYNFKANKREREKKSPTYKDLDFMDILPEGLLLEPETYSALVSS